MAKKILKTKAAKQPKDPRDGSVLESQIESLEEQILANRSNAAASKVKRAKIIALKLKKKNA